MKFENRYTFFDRVLHRFAFRAGMAQEAIADMEAILHRSALDSIPLECPVSISGLPRSGTTILLNTLWASGRFGSHTYRDMPFVLCPLMWSRFSRFMSRESRPTERAHGDGLQISSDSPEAFDEIVWKRFWPEHYLSDRILPWNRSDTSAEFNDFFEKHMKKVVAVRSDDPSHQLRYLSKSNLNIARLPALPPSLARGKVIIPFRDPVQQSVSMLRQHERFLKIHDEDGFVLKYMNAVGHHEFGRGLRPVDFDGWLSEAPSPATLAFWLRYWIVSYRHVRQHLGSSAVLVSYARLTEEPEDVLAEIAVAIDLPPADLASRAEMISQPRSHAVQAGDVPSDLLQEARELYHGLEQESALRRD